MWAVYAFMVGCPAYNYGHNQFVNVIPENVCALSLKSRDTTGQSDKDLFGVSLSCRLAHHGQASNGKLLLTTTEIIVTDKTFLLKAIMVHCEGVQPMVSTVLLITSFIPLRASSKVEWSYRLVTNRYLLLINHFSLLEWADMSAIEWKGT